MVPVGPMTQPMLVQMPEDMAPGRVEATGWLAHGITAFVKIPHQPTTNNWLMTKSYVFTWWSLWQQHVVKHGSNDLLKNMKEFLLHNQS